MRFIFIFYSGVCRGFAYCAAWRLICAYILGTTEHHVCFCVHPFGDAYSTKEVHTRIMDMTLAIALIVAGVVVGVAVGFGFGIVYRKKVSENGCKFSYHKTKVF